MSIFSLWKQEEKKKMEKKNKEALSVNRRNPAVEFKEQEEDDGEYSCCGSPLMPRLFRERQMSS